MLLTLIILWVSTVTIGFLINLYRHILVDKQDDIELTQTKRENIIGIVKPATVSAFDDDEIIGEEELPLPAGAVPIKSEPDTKQNERVEQYCAEMLLQEPQEENIEACGADEVENHFEAVTGDEQEFTQKINDPDKLAELTQTNTKLSGSVYYQKLKENNEAGSKVARLAEIAQDLYKQKLEKMLLKS